MSRLSDELLDCIEEESSPQISRDTMMMLVQEVRAARNLADAVELFLEGKTTEVRLPFILAEYRGTNDNK